MRRMIILVFVASAVGLIAGMYAPRSSQASHLALHFAPPTNVAYSNSRLTTGWHSNGVSLDWDWYGGTTVYARAWGYIAQPSAVPVAWGSVRTAPWGGCNNTVWMDLYDWNAFTYLGSMVYTHTERTGGTVSGATFYGSSGFFYNSGAPVSVMSTWDTCAWTGQHVHETHDPVSFLGIQSGAYPTGNISGCPPGCPLYNNAWIGNWTRGKNW